MTDMGVLTGVVFLSTVLLVLAFGMKAQADDSAGSLFPLLVGGEAHGVENIDTLADLGIGNLVWIPAPGYSMGNTPWDEENDIFADIDACLRNGFFFMPSQRRGLGDPIRPGGFGMGGHGSGEMYPLEVLARMKAAGGTRMVGVHAEEMDIDLIQDTIRPAYAARVPELRNYTDPEGGRVAFQGEMERLNKRYTDLGIRFFPNLCVTHQHCGYRAGAALVLGELFEHLPTTELQLAYLRGAAHQFDKPWGVWISPWFWGRVPTEDKTLWPAPQAQIGGGHSVEMFRRALYLSFVSGARLITLQETEPLFSRAPDGEGYVLARWGREFKTFWDYAKRHDAPFVPIVPLAVLIDQDNGWEPAHLCQNWNPHESVWGKLPIDRRADGMLREYFNVLLPGFMRTAESVRNRTDEFPGYFAATPHGPFDVLASDVKADRLAAYPVVVALGGMDMTGALLRELKAYVSQGGVLLLNVYSMLHRNGYVQDPAFLGAMLKFRVNGGKTIQWCGEMEGMEKRTFEEDAFATVQVDVGSGEVLAADEKGNPVLLAQSYGEGTVYLSTVEYMMRGWESQVGTLRFFETFIGALARQAPVWVEASDGLSWVASRQGDELVVAISNHAKAPHAAKVMVAGHPLTASLDVGLGKVDRQSVDGRTQFTFEVAGRDVSVLRIAGAW